MAPNNDDQAQVREYLLGRLSDEEQQKIEERLMVEDELLEELEVSKDEVIEDYRTGELSQNERRWLEAHFLASTEGRQRYLFALTMDRFQHPQPLPEPKPRPSLFARLVSLMKSQPLVFATAGSAALVIVLAALFVPSLMSSRGAVFQGPTLVGSATSRGEGAPPVPKIKLPDDVAKVKLRLVLPKDFPAATHYKAELDNKVNSRPVDVVEVGNDAVAVMIPKELIPPGEYLIELTAIDANGASRPILREYLFNID